MKKWSIVLLKCLALVAVLCFGLAHSAQADNTFAVTTQVYYVGPSSDPSGDNPFGLSHSGGNSISSFNGGITSAGGLETVTFDAVTSADVNSTPAVSVLTGPITMELFGYGNATAGSGSLGTTPPATPLVNAGGTLNAGTFTFSACPGASPGGVNTDPIGSVYGDYFGINDNNSANGGLESAAVCNNPSVPCLKNSSGNGFDQLCVAGDSPSDLVVINVTTTGLVTITAGSFEAAFSEVPELPSLALFGTGLLAMGIFFRKKGFAV
jgi:hypothetical protein